MLLAETQSAIRAALLAQANAPDATPAHRIAIHRRHYRASLMTALATKFPATVWLLGSTRFNEAAEAFVHTFPPTAPCIAEYGEDFPEFVGALPGQEAPYLADVAKADWHLGRVSIAISEPPLAITTLAGIAPERLADVSVTLQPGLRFLESEWPIDALIALHLGGDAPERFVLNREPVCLQIRGARGTFSIDRPDAATFAFRRSLAEGAALGGAAEAGLSLRADFDPGAALGALFAAGLVVAADLTSREDPS